MEILIADDDFIARSLLKKILESLGHEVLIAEDGLQAWKLIQKNKNQIVITDWMMPGMDGLELCRTIRENQTWGYVFIILITAKDSKNDIITGLEAGADDYLSKPFNHAELVARLNSGLRILKLESTLQKANEEIKILAITDTLTRCCNRLYLNEHLPKEIKRAWRYGRSFSIIMCDIDYFKKINDTYGHLAGDKVLEIFARCIRESIRNNIDWVARYGGEEFLIVLPETGARGALNLAERLCSNISRMIFEIEDEKIHITASFGVIGFDPDTPDDKISSQAMISQCDKLLYKAKMEGRNRVEGGQL